MTSKTARTGRELWRARAASALAGWLAIGMATPRLAFAGPENPQVQRGDVQIESVGDTTLIHASDRSIINYSGFDIGAHETVRFIQPSESASVLNRIQSSKPTLIEGALLANGRVYLVNPAGVYFSESATVDVAHLIAAAGHISTDDFLAGTDHFTGISGEVGNAGRIHAELVELIGRYVSNSGNISAPDGLILLAAGDDVLVGEPGSRLYLKLDAQAPADPARAGVEQSGTLEAPGGRISLEAGDLYGLAILHSGTSRADEVQIAGGDTGLVELKGTLDASNDAPGGVGGRIEVTGEKIALRDALLDASGQAGGGTVLVGGDYQGSGETRTAQQTFVDPDSALRADAQAQGDGGKVVVWADGTTGFHGRISARGGDAGGDGGQVEVSGKDTLFFRGDVDTRAPEGLTGSLLLDPVNLTVANGTGDGAADGTNTFAGDPSGTTGVVLAGDTAPVTIFESELEGLGATTNIALSASQSLTIQNLSDNLLALPTIDPDGPGPNGTVRFTAGTAFSMDAGDTIRTEGASITITGASVALGSLDTRGASGTLGGPTSGINVSSTGTGTLVVRGINAGGGNVALSSGSGTGPTLLVGSIADDGNAATRIAGNTLTLTTSQGGTIGNVLAPIGTDITGALTVSKLGGGGLTLSEANGLIVAGVNAGAGGASLTAEAGSITDDGNVNTVINANVMALRAAGAGGSIGTVATPIRATLGANGRIDATAANGVFYTQVLNGLRVGTVDAGIGDSVLTALSGAMVDDGNAASFIHANNLSLITAAGAAVGTAGVPIATNLSGVLTVLRPPPPNANVPGGGIFVTQSNDMRIGNILAPAFIASNNPAGALPQGVVTLTSTNGSILDDGDPSTGIAGSVVTLTANGPGASIGTAGAPIGLNSEEALPPPPSPQPSPPVGRTGPTIPWTLSASAPNGGGIFVRQSQGIKLGAINAGAGTFSLTATAGRILDDGDAATVVKAGSLALAANGTFRIYADPSPNPPFPGPVATPPAFIGTLSTQNVSNLTASANGGIAIANSGGGDLTLGAISSTTGGFTLTHDGGDIVIGAPVALGATNTAIFALDTPHAIEFRIPSLTAGGAILLNRGIAPDQIAEPRLATIFVAPGTSGDPAADARNLTLTSSNTDILMGEGQSFSVPGALTLDASRRVTLADAAALDLTVSGSVANIFLRGPKSIFEADGNVVTDQGGDLIANHITLNIGTPIDSTGDGTPTLFVTADGTAPSGAPNGSRFGRPVGGAALTPADFLGTGGAAAGQVLDLFGITNTTSGSPDAVPPTLYPVHGLPIDLAQLNAAAEGSSFLRGTDLLAFLRCSNAPGDDPDRVPVDCLGYSAKEERAPFGTPEAATARAHYRALYTERAELSKTLGTALEAYRASGQGAPSDGAAFRRFLEQDPAQVEAQDAVRRLEELMGELDGLMGGGRAGNERLEYWRQQLLDDFTPEGMSVEQLDATLGGPSVSRTAGL